MQIEFDETKRKATIEVRGLDMARAEEIFNDSTFTIEDTRKQYGELRYISAGFLDGEMVILVWTPRNGKRRIISLRKANERERKSYGRKFRS